MAQILLTPAQYAAHRGVTVSSVSFAIGRKRIELREDGLIDRDAADLSWDAHETRSRPGPKPETPSYRTQEARELMLARAEKEQAHTARELMFVKLRELEYEKKKGTLVSRELVEKQAFDDFRKLRDGCFAIPERLAGVLAVETDEAAVYQLLRDEIERVFRGFAQGKEEAA